MDYLEFYGLETEPFSSAPISRFYFNSAQHQRALVRLMYAVDTMKGLAVLIGELGTGKTTLARRMLDNLPEEEYESALLVIIHSGITADWLLSRIARQLGVEDPAPEKLKLLNQLYNRLVDLNEEGKKAVVLIDEAQMLQSKEIMEEFRGLLNLELPESKLITFVFFGLPDLEDCLHLDEPLAQRVALKCSLDSFTLESTQGYINHRLRLAGAQQQLFPADTIKLVHHFSRGIPRIINTICDNAMFEGYLLKKKAIKPDLIQAVATDLGLAPTPGAKRRTVGGRPAQVIRVPGRQIQQSQQVPAPPPPGVPPTEYEPSEVPPPREESPHVVEMEEEGGLGIGESFEMEETPEPPAQAEQDKGPPQVPSEPPPLAEQPAPPTVQEEGEDLDAMFNSITEDKEDQAQKHGEEGENIDKLFNDLEEK